MSWLDELDTELRAAGIHGRTRRRIGLELADHLACEPGSESRLGSPREVAERFAAELRIVRTRRSTWVAFAALALTAVGMGATTEAYAAAGGWPDVAGARGLAVALTGIVILLAPQVAFVAGMLGAIRAYGFRRQREVAVAELALVQRRMAVGIAAGALTAAVMAAHVALLWSLMPWWWGVVALCSALVPGAALVASALALRGAQGVTPSDPGPAEGLIGDVPARLRPRVESIVEEPRRLLLIVGVPVCLLVLAGTAHAEQSLLEGLERAVAEALAIAGGFAALGRRLGLR